MFTQSLSRAKWTFYVGAVDDVPTAGGKVQILITSNVIGYRTRPLEFCYVFVPIAAVLWIFTQTELVEKNKQFYINTVLIYQQQGVKRPKKIYKKYSSS
jgi:hypothetical protein